MRFASRIIFYFLCLFVSFQGEAQTLELRSNTTPETHLTQSSIWEICNETSFIIRLSTAIIREGKMRPKGWDEVVPGQCFPIEVPENSPRYIFAESSSVHQGGIREWAGQTPICTSSRDFIADTNQSCQLQNLESRNYFAVDPTEQRTSLIEPNNFKTKAEIAGIQRLLHDNGYKVSRIDGLSGRRTNRYIREFKKKSQLPADTSNLDLIDALALKAKEKQSDIGFKVCNTSNATIWTAIATRDNGVWQSRGWWEVPKTECLRPFTKPLKGTDAHFFALQENIVETEKGKSFGPDKRLRSVATTPTQFCIAEAKFSALGRDYCAESGYAVASFRPLPTDIDGTKVNLSDQDFAVPSSVGLR